MPPLNATGDTSKSCYQSFTLISSNSEIALTFWVKYAARKTPSNLSLKEPEAKLQEDHGLKKTVVTSSHEEPELTLKNDRAFKNGLVKETKSDKPSNNQPHHSDSIKSRFVITFLC